MVNIKKFVAVALTLFGLTNGGVAEFLKDGPAGLNIGSPNKTRSAHFSSVPISPYSGSVDAMQPHQLQKRYSQGAAAVCQSPAFDLTSANWRDAGANEFLRRWAYDFIGDREYSMRGILGSLAQAFLGRNDFRCTVGSSHSCMVTCNEVVSLVEDPHDARALYFIMTAGRHYLEVIEVADKALLAAQVNVGQWSDMMAARFYWTQETNHDRVFRLTVRLMQDFVGFILFTFAPMAPFHLLEKAIESKLTEIPDNAEAPHGAQIDQAAMELMQKKETLEKTISGVKSAAKWAQVGYGAVSSGVPFLGIPAAELMTWEGYEKAQILNIAELGMAISQLITETRHKNLKAVEEAFSGRVIDATGGTMLGQILEGGSYLAVNSQMMHQWSGHQAEKRLTDALKYRIFSEALKSQGVYIHCTKKMNAFSCENDDRGPQNLKACIDNRVCYMNKWSGRGYWWRHHVEEPFGTNQMGDWPMLVTPEDIIISSYKTYKQEKTGKTIGKFATQEELLSPQAFMDASTPGSFFLPVCVNDRFAQITTLDDYKLWDNFNQSSEKKTLPCSCGEFWGDETEQVWHDTGLGIAKHQEKYRSSFCPRQLKKKIGDNKLERFVADCHLRVSKGGLFNGYKDGKHPFCDVVMDIIKAHGRSPDDIDPYLKLALECKAGLHVTRIRGKPKKECEMYVKTGFEELVNKKHPKAATWFPEGV
ncbi:hypothetical protein EV426DRAFT_708149 [Tirmania nivea]|nr:hypothetical protein EV426DRAFT_708149 [Tirmania nivea]